MIPNRMRSLTLAMLLAVASTSALAGSTGPTNPATGGPKVPGTGLEKNTDGTTPGAPGTSPGVKGMDPAPAAPTGNETLRDKKHEAGKAGMGRDNDQDDDDDTAP